MVRRPRIHYRGALYNVTVRGSGGNAVYFRNQVRQSFEGLVYVTDFAFPPFPHPPFHSPVVSASAVVRLLLISFETTAEERAVSKFCH